MRVLQTRPLNPFPDLTTIQDEKVRKFLTDLADSLTKMHRNISDDINNLQNLDTVDSLPTATKEYQGRLVVLKGSGTSPDEIFLCIDTGGSGFVFKKISLI